MQFLDARRITGPNIFWDKPGAILDIACSPADADKLAGFCESQLRRMLQAVGWGDESVRHIQLAGGFSIAFSAPIDALYAASAIQEWLWSCCDAEFNDAVAVDFTDSAAQIRAAIDDEKNPAILELDDAAKAHGVSFLWDDDEVSVGLGSGSEVWPVSDLPALQAIDWQRCSDVPVAIVTGTNGKTTSVRIAKHILQASGKNTGVSCTDWVAVNDRIIDRDDWSGPGGARLVLRQKDVDVAILETARGGLLRRGLGVTRAEVALITNIAEDHLGDFGSQNLQELLNIKWIVSHAVTKNGYLVLNADDALLVKKATDYTGKLIWFSLSGANPVVRLHVQRGGLAYVYDEENLYRLEGDSQDLICAAGEIPLTLDGAALHNVANCLGAVALTERLGVTLQQIREGLVTMSQDANPGRSNLFTIDGFRVLVDFAHNPEAMQALFAMATALPAKRRVLCFGQAGDRTDEQIRELARSAWAIGIQMAIVSELEKYARGRAKGEVFAIIRDELVLCGAKEHQIRHFETERESFDDALDWANAGDLVVILDLGRNSDIQKKLQSME